MREILTAPENRKHLCGRLPGNREEWDEIKPRLTWGGRELWKLGFWNLLAETGNFEMYQYIRDGFGYYSLAENWNAAEALQSIFLDEPDEEAQPDRIYHSRPGEAGYQTLAYGFDSLPRTLRALLKAAGCEVCLDTRLVRFERRDSGWVLGLNGPGEKERTVEAGKLILALPRTALEQLAPSNSFSLGTDAELRRRIQSVTPIPAFKLFLFYKTRWWERLGITVGRSVSDLPLRQTYYFAPDRKSGRTSDYGLLMASYSDAGAVAFWSSLIQDDPLPGGAARSPFAEFVHQLGLDGGPKPPPDLHGASREMLRHAKAQLALLHDLPEASIPDPEGGAYACWGAEPGGCGWNFWNPGVQVNQMMPQVRTPLGDASVCIVGEAYSGIQGWVEGALTTTERALQDHLDLDPPGWLREDYYLGR